MSSSAASSSLVGAPILVPLLAMFMAVMDGFIVIVAGPAIQADLGANAGQLQWVLAAYQLSYATSMITASRIADLVGRRRVFLLGNAVFLLTSIGCALAPSPEVLILARLLQGLGAAMIVPQVFAMLTLQVPARGHPRLFGVVSIVIAVASMGGQLVGGLLVGLDVLGSSWRSVFWINVPIGLVILVLARRAIPAFATSSERTLDLPGIAVLSGGLLLLTVPLIQGRESGWAWWTWASFVCSAAAVAGFVAVERRAERRGREPLLRLALFRQRSFTVGLVLVTALYAMLTSYYLALSVAMQEGLGLSALQASLVYAPAPLTFFVFGIVAGRLIPRHGRRVLEVGSLVLAFGYGSTAVVLLATGTISPQLVIPTLMLQAVGGGLVITPSLNVVLSRIEPDAVGTAAGALSTAQQIGAALGVAVIGTIFFSSFHPDLDGPEAAACRAFAMASLGVLSISALVVVLVRLLPTTRGPR